MLRSMAKELITASRSVQAPPAKVWRAVADLTAMGRRSPQCRRMFVLGKGEPGVGTVTVNLNRRGVLFWPTWSRVTVWEPGKRLEWRVPLNGSRWRYDLAADGDGATTLTESRVVEGDTSLLSRFLVATALGGEQDFEAELLEGIRRTLDAVAGEVEQAG